MAGDVPAKANWMRGPELLDITSRVGERLREVRTQRKLSLKEVGAATGLHAATLSRIENNKMAPTIGLLTKIVDALDLSWDEILPSEGQQLNRMQPRATIAPANTPILRLGDVDYQRLHATNPLSDILASVTMTVSYQTVKEAGGLIGHVHTEFCYVLDGTLDLHFRNEPLKTLHPGDSVLFDAGVPHAYTSHDGNPVRVLMVLSSDTIDA